MISVLSRVSDQSSYQPTDGRTLNFFLQCGHPNVTEASEKGPRKYVNSEGSEKAPKFRMGGGGVQSVWENTFEI